MTSNCFHQVAGITLAAVVVVLLSSNVVAQRISFTLKCDPVNSSDNAKTGTQSADTQKDKDTPSLKLKLSLPAAVEQVTPALDSKSLSQQLQARPPAVLPIGCIGLFIVEVLGNGPPNQTVVFHVVQSNPLNIMGFRWGSTGPFADTIDVPVAIGPDGTGESDPFEGKGELLGETTLTPENPTMNGIPLDVIVAECNCPIIPTKSPPRN